MWLYVPSACVPEAPDWNSESGLPDESTVSALASSVTWKGKLTQPRSWLNAFKKASWTRRLSGVISARSTLNRGAERWISSLADTRVNRSPLPVDERGPTTPATSGPSSQRSFGWSSPESASSRTSTDTSPSVTEKSDKSWKAWATALRKRSLARRKQLRHTLESDSSSWPTATVTDHKAGAEGYSTESGRLSSTTLTDAIKQWGTPRVSAYRAAEGGLQRHHRERVKDQSIQWLTPATPSGGRSVPASTVESHGSTQEGKRQVGLESQTKHWPTPAAMMNDGETFATFDSRAEKLKEKKINGNGAGRLLGPESTRFTLQALSSTTPGPEWLQTYSLLSRVWESFELRKSLRLNPDFTEWLMGWPPGWSRLGTVEPSDYNYWETASSRLLQRLVGFYAADNSSQSTNQSADPS